MTDTPSKILDTAERLFGEEGYAGTSLRQIIAEAGVNLAAVHYHFGSKEDLLDQIVVRKAGPVNEERLAMLDQLEQTSGEMKVEEVVRAFLQPPFLKIDQQPGFSKLMGRLYSEGAMPAIVSKHFQPVIVRFMAAFDRALPHLGPTERALRLQFMIGSMAHVLFGMRNLNPFRPALPAEPKILLDALIVYLSAGLQAPASLPEKDEEIR